VFSYQYAFTDLKYPCCLYHLAKIPVGAYQLNGDKMLKNKKTHLTSMVSGLLIADSAISLTVLNYRPVNTT